MSVFINYNYLIELYNWMAVNSLHINETKTTQFHINTLTCPIYLTNILISPQDSIKGLTITHEFSITKHI